MVPWLMLTCACLAAFPGAEVETITGETLTGELVEISPESLLLRIGNETRSVAGAAVLEIRQQVSPLPLPPGPRVELLDGSRLSCREVAVLRDKAQLSLHSGEVAQVPASRLSAIRIGESTPALDAAWTALRQREGKNDLLVVRKDEVLDFVPGVAGEFGEKLVFLVDGEELPVPRERVYGLIYRRRNVAAGKIACQVRLSTGDTLQGVGVTLAEGVFEVRLGGNVVLKVPAEQVAALDYSAGKVVYLSQLKPREKELTPFFDRPHDIQTDRSQLGPALKLGGRNHARGLGLFPRTRLRYRLAGEYSNFRALAGIDDAAPRLKTVVLLRISGDGRELFNAEFAPADPPRPIELNVSGVRELEILVDFGSDQLDTGDYLDLADAKLTK